MAIYDQSTLGTDNNFVTFNDYTTTPIYRVTSRAPQQRDIRDLDIPIPFESGISDFETLIGRMVYVISGKLYPGGDGDADSGVARLRKVSNLDLNQADVLSDDGYVPYTWSEFVRDKRVYVKPLYVQMVEDTRQGLTKDFRIICKVKDPTIYEDELRTASTAPADFTTASGTAIFPFSFPIIFGASTSSVSIDAYNYGDMPVYPISIQVYGPVNSPKITNTTTGEYIQVNNNLATTSNNLSISYDKDSLVVEIDGNSAISNVTSDSTYWKLQPGSNTIELTGSSISNDAYCVITFRSGWPLS